MRSAESESFSHYFPPTKAFADCGCQVLSMGFERIGAGERYPRRDHPDDHLFTYQRGRILSSYVIEVLTSGAGNYESEKFRSTPLSAGDVCLVFPEIRHRYRPKPEVGWSKWWVELCGPLADQWMEVAGFSPEHSVLPHAGCAPLVGAFEDLAVAARADQAFQPLLTSSLALQIIARMQAGLGKPLAREDNRLRVVRAARHLIHEQTANPRIAWEDLASNLGVGYSSLRKSFMQLMGLSPGQYHLSLRQRRAVELLRNSDLPIAAIAELLGFESIYYFSRFIKQRTGLSPRALRSRPEKGFPDAGNDLE